MKLIHSAVTALVLGATAIASANADTLPSWLGQPTPSDQADRTIVIDAGTRWANVTQGEKVKFVANGQEFVVDFNGVAGNADLGNFAPSGVLDHKVRVYVGESPLNAAN
jgi:hypothetical protein